MKFERQQRAVRTFRPLVDALLTASGPQAFATWQKTMTPLMKSQFKSISRLGRTLIAAPTPPGHYMPVDLDGSRFRYVGSRLDDLSYLAKFNLMPWEIVTRLFWQTLSRSSPFVVDVGASTGVYTLTALASNSKLRVLAVEPNPHMLSILLANVQLNVWLNRTSVLGVAASDQNSVVELGLNDPAGGAGLVSLERPLTGNGHVLVATMPLASLARGARAIRIDVEGYERSVLKGLRDLLEQDHPTLVCEALTEGDLSRQRDILIPLGYSDPVVVCRQNGLLATAGILSGQRIQIEAPYYSRLRKQETGR